jgi:alanine-glyoxylate transaminase/serine-glyoxylate transaminase/serine-pyruvate transaminase
MVHAETSTGVKNPAAEIGMLLQNGGPFYLLDVVTSLGGINVAVDEWGVDAAYSGSQKCLSCPPGLSPVTFSERATRYITKRKRAVPNWYLDMGMILEYWEGKQRVYHHTAPINMLYALYQSLLLFSNEGSDNVFKRHLECHQHLVKSLNNLGISMFVEEPNRLPMLNAVRIPENVNDSIARELLRNKYKIEIGNGLGPLAGRIWRIGLMGYTAQKENVDALIDALTPVIEKSGK